MCRGVVAGDRVLGHQEPGQEDVEEDQPVRRPSVEPGVVDRLSEHVADRAVIVRDCDQHADDEEDAVMCHQAENAFSIAVIDTLNMLISPAASMIPAYVR